MVVNLTMLTELSKLIKCMYCVHGDTKLWNSQMIPNCRAMTPLHRLTV